MKYFHSFVISYHSLHESTLHTTVIATPSVRIIIINTDPIFLLPEIISLQFWLLQKQMLMSTSTCLTTPLWSTTSTAWKVSLIDYNQIFLSIINLEVAITSEIMFIHGLSTSSEYQGWKIFQFRTSNDWIRHTHFDPDIFLWCRNNSWLQEDRFLQRDPLPSD